MGNEIKKLLSTDIYACMHIFITKYLFDTLRYFLQSKHPGIPNSKLTVWAARTNCFYFPILWSWEFKYCNLSPPPSRIKTSLPPTLSRSSLSHKANIDSDVVIYRFYYQSYLIDAHRREPTTGDRKTYQYLLLCHIWLALTQFVLINPALSGYTVSTYLIRLLNRSSCCADSLNVIKYMLLTRKIMCGLVNFDRFTVVPL